MVLNMTSEGLKGPWQPEEDKDLIRAVELWGSEPHCWRSVSEEFNKTRAMVHNRSMKQCRERYLLHLRPDISNDPWTHDEDALIVQGHKLHGNKWQEIAKLLPGRTESSVKNHWNATLRRKFKFNDPAEQAPLRKYIRELLADGDERLPSNGAMSPMGSAGTMSQPGSAKKLRIVLSHQHSHRMAGWSGFDPQLMQRPSHSPPEDEDWAQEEMGVPGPNLLMGSRSQRNLAGEQAADGSSQPTGSGGAARKGGHIPAMSGLAMGMAPMSFPGPMGMIAPAMMRGMPGMGNKPSAHGMVQYMQMGGPHMMFAPGAADGGEGGPSMLPSTSLRIQTKRSVRPGQHGLAGHGSASGSGGHVASDLTRVEMVGGRRAAGGAGASPQAEVVASDQDSLAVSGGNTPRGQRPPQQRTPHSHATHPMQWEMPHQRFMAAAAAAGYPMEDEAEEEEEEDAGAGAEGDRKRKTGKLRPKKDLAAMADMMMGGPGSWPAAMMMMPPQMMMAAAGAMGEDGEEEGSGAEPTGTGEASPSAAKRKKGRMTGNPMAMQGWPMMMPMGMGMGAHPAAMQMMMQQHAMMQHMGMGQGGSPMAAGAMMPWGPWGMPMMMGGHRKRKSSKAARDGPGDGATASENAAAGAGDSGDEEGSQAGGPAADDDGTAVTKRGSRQATGELATRVLPGQARVQRQQRDGEEDGEGGSHSRGTGGPDGDGDQDGDEGADGVRRSKRSTRPSTRVSGGMPAAAALVAATAAPSGSPRRSKQGPGGSGGANSDPERQHSSHSQAALKKRSSLQPAGSGHLSDGAVGPPLPTNSGTRSRLAQQHSVGLTRHATAQPQGSGRGIGNGGGPTWSGRGADVESGSVKRRRVADMNAEAEADSLFGTLLAAAAAIESEGDSLEQKPKPTDGDTAEMAAGKRSSDELTVTVSGTETAKNQAATVGTPSAAAAALPPASSPMSARIAKPSQSVGAYSQQSPSRAAGSVMGRPDGVVADADPRDTPGSGRHRPAVDWDVAPQAAVPVPSGLGPSRSGRQASDPKVEQQVEWPEPESLPAPTGQRQQQQAITRSEPYYTMASEMPPALEIVPHDTATLAYAMSLVPHVSGGHEGRGSSKRGGSGAISIHHSHLSSTLPKSKTAWSKMESDLLCKFVDEYGGTANTTPWTFVAHKLNTAMREAHMRMGPGMPYCERTSKQCRERWIHNLAPHVCKDAWTEEENNTLAEAHKQYGNQWSRVARLLPGRTENTVKNHWNATLRRKQPARLVGGGISSLDVYMVMSGLKIYDPDTTAEIWAQIEAAASAKIMSPDGADAWQQLPDIPQLQWGQQDPGAPSPTQPTQADDQGYVQRGPRGGARQQSASLNPRNSSGGGAAAPSAGDMSAAVAAASVGFSAQATAAEILQQLQQLQQQSMLQRAGVAQSVAHAMPLAGGGMSDGGMLGGSQGLGSPQGGLQQGMGGDLVQLQQAPPLNLPMNLGGITWDQATTSQQAWEQPPAQQQQAWEQAPGSQPVWQRGASAQTAWDQAPPLQQQQQWDQTQQTQQLHSLEQLMQLAQNSGIQLTSLGGGAMQIQQVTAPPLQSNQPGPAPGPLPVSNGGALTPTFTHTQLTQLAHGQGTAEQQMWGQLQAAAAVAEAAGGQSVSRGPSISGAPAHSQRSVQAPQPRPLQQLPVPPPPTAPSQQPPQVQYTSTTGSQLQQFPGAAAALQQLQQFTAPAAQLHQYGGSQVQQVQQPYTTTLSQPPPLQYTSGGGLQSPVQQYAPTTTHQTIQYSGQAQVPPMPPPMPGGTWVYHQAVPATSNYVLDPAGGAGGQSGMEHISGGGAVMAGGMMDGVDLPPVGGARSDDGHQRLNQAGVPMGGVGHVPLAVSMGSR